MKVETAKNNLKINTNKTIPSAQRPH